MDMLRKHKLITGIVALFVVGGVVSGVLDAMTHPRPAQTHHVAKHHRTVTLPTVQVTVTTTSTTSTTTTTTTQPEKIVYVTRTPTTTTTTVPPVTTTTSAPPVTTTTGPPTPQTVVLGAVDPTDTQSTTNPLTITFVLSATAVDVTNDVQTKAATLPVGVLQLDMALAPGQPSGLVCSINVGGQTKGGDCPVTLEATGTFLVTSTYFSGTASNTASETVTISPFSVEISAKDTGSGVGTTFAPDGATCTAGVGKGCQLMAATLYGDRGETLKMPSVGDLTFTIYNGTTPFVTLTPKKTGQTYCLVDWYSDTTGSSATSPDCTGNASLRTEIIGFPYSAHFAASGYESATTGIQ